MLKCLSRYLSLLTDLFSDRRIAFTKIRLIKLLFWNSTHTFFNMAAYLRFLHFLPISGNLSKGSIFVNCQYIFVIILILRFSFRYCSPLVVFRGGLFRARFCRAGSRHLKTARFLPFLCLINVLCGHPTSYSFQSSHSGSCLWECWSRYITVDYRRSAKRRCLGPEESLKGPVDKAARFKSHLSVFRKHSSFPHKSAFPWVHSAFPLGPPPNLAVVGP